MCYAIGCACLGQSAHFLGVATSLDDRFGVPASVSSRNAVGSFVDRFRWPHPISHDWPTTLPSPLAFSSQDARRDRRFPEPHLDIKSPPAPRFASGAAPADFLATTKFTAMEFSGKDLEDIQRVAGLLGVTVDELLQQSRAQSQNTESSPLQQPALGHNLSQQHVLGEDQVPASQHSTSLDLDSDPFDLVTVGSSGSGSTPSDLMLPPAVAHDQSEVILLNPHTTWYDCDAPWGVHQSLDESPNFDDIAMDSETTGDGSYVRLTEMELDTASLSEHTARGEADGSALDDASTDWAIVSPSPESAALQSPMSPSTGSADNRYHRIAPRLAKPAPQSASDSSSARVKKKRSAYERSKRVDTHLTRQLHACVRCRMQRNRVRIRSCSQIVQRWSCRVADHSSVSPIRPTLAAPV